MTDEEIVRFRFSRINSSLNGLVSVLRPFLLSKNAVASPNREAKAAFNLLERFCYNAHGVSLLLGEYTRNHNMALPISQIFRAMSYDAIIAHWLFGEANAFSDRMGAFNSDFIRKMTSRVKELKDKDSEEKIVGDAEMQRIWRGWQEIAPDSFSIDSAGELAPIRHKKHEFQFQSIGKHVVEKHNETFLRPLINAYDVLSQQAHTSEFSKELIYQKSVDHIHIFDSISHAILPTSLLLLYKIEDSDTARAAIISLDSWYPISKEPLTDEI